MSIGSDNDLVPFMFWTIVQASYDEDNKRMNVSLGDAMH